MEYVQTNKFEVTDMPGMNTLAFLVEEDVSLGTPFFGLQKLQPLNIQADGKINKEFSVINEGKQQDIVLLTLANKKAILSSGILDDSGFKPADINKSVSYGSIFNADGIQYKEFVYTPNMKRRFTIIDTVTYEEVKPVLFVDEDTKEVKGRCKILPLRTYIVLEIANSYARMVGMASELDAQKLEFTAGIEIPVQGLEKNLEGKEPDGMIV